jgi:uncharacterized membrane protein YgdD (TMEM256/DUF423 family)
LLVVEAFVVRDSNLYTLGMFSRFCIFFGGLAGSAAVAMAALAAHGLASLSPAALGAVRNTIEMQGWHAIALVAVGAWLPHGGLLARLAASGFALGTLLFCGGVYGHELADLPVGAFAPVGGTMLILSWLVLAASAFRRSA